MPDILIANPVFTLFLLLLIGNAIGLLTFRGISLGSAGVILTALVFGHFGLKLPKELTDLGLILFIYAVGLSAGPGFFKALRLQGKPLVIVSLVSLSLAAVLCIVLGRVFGIPREIAAGIFAGSLTNTPSLASGMELASKLGLSTVNLSVGYGIAYPYSIIVATLAVQLLPRFLGKSLKKEEDEAQKQQALQANKLTLKQFIVTNPACLGESIKTLQLHRFGNVNISRIYRNKQFEPAISSTLLERDDILTLVGEELSLEQVRLLFGTEVSVPLENARMSSLDVALSSHEFVGKTLNTTALGDKYNIIVTRVRKYDGNEIAPVGTYELEDGDVLRVVGIKEDVENFVSIASDKPSRAGDFHILPLLLGLVAGTGIGIIPIPLPGGGQFTLGMATGALLVSLILGYYGKLGSIHFRISSGAINLARELGLVLFLAGAGVSAGGQFVKVFLQVGPAVLIIGFVVTTVTLLCAIFMLTVIFKLSIFTTDGAMAGLMTNPPALAAAKSQSATEIPTLSYATIYPFAMLMKIILIQVILLVFGLGAS